MKIITDDKVYVQLNDIMYLFRSRIKGVIPSSIINHPYLESSIQKNRNIFIEFNDPTEIEFFKNLDCSVDYLSFKDLPREEVIQYIYSAENEKMEIIKSFNLINTEKIENNFDVLTQCELLDFKIFSINDILLFKEGQLQFDLPEGIAYPNGVSPNLDINEKLMKRKFRFFRRFNTKKS